MLCLRLLEPCRAWHHRCASCVQHGTLTLTTVPSLCCARPAMGVLQLPSSAVRKARSQTTASRVSSWFSVASSRAALSSPSLQAMPIAPCRAEHVSQYTGEA